MIFLRYESFRSYVRLYPVTVALIAANLLYFSIVGLTGTMMPERLYQFGGFVSFPDDAFAFGEPWRYVTTIFMHSGLEHLLYNMFSLLVFAPPLERLIGSLRYLVFYLLSGIAGVLLSALAYSLEGVDYPLLGVGASGAIYGVFGAYLFIALFRKLQLDEQSRKTVYAILVFGILYSIIVPRVSLWGHLGGLIAGFLLYRLFDRIKTRKR